MFSTAETLEIAFKFLSTYASLAGVLFLLRTAAGEVFLEQLKSFFESLFHYFFTLRSTHITLVINEFNGISRNQVYDAAHLYLPEKIGPKTKRLVISKTERQKDFTFSIEDGEEIIDVFGGTQFRWRYIHKEPPPDQNSEEKYFFELSFNKKFKDKAVKDYLPKVLEKAKEITEATRVVKIYSFDSESSRWRSMIPEHPATFKTVAMDPDLKDKVINDLNAFVGKKDFFKKVGRAWKRGYLLYGPSGTGKSTLIAAMANYLKFDIYDLELASIYSNSSLRNALLSTTNRSILVIEDIDCSIQLQDRKNQLEPPNDLKRLPLQLTLSGILNCIDGLWSSCGDEKIVVFTTNYKDKLDKALLRPGRTDMHIPMSYCTPYVFRHLAGNYIGLEDHERFGEIEKAIEMTKVTPAEVAEQLMRNYDDHNALLNDLIKFLEEKKQENEQENAKKNRAQEESTASEGRQTEEEEIE